MDDPNKGRLNISTAEEMLDMTEMEKIVMRNAAAIDLLMQHAQNITEHDIELAYEQRLKVQLREVRDNLDSLVRGGLDEA